MNRIEFMQSIIRTNRSLENDIIDFFDHEMLLYELIGSANSKITVTDSTSKNISFHIDTTKGAVNSINMYLLSYGNNPMVLYDKPLLVQHSVASDKSLDITISTL